MSTTVAEREPGAGALVRRAVAELPLLVVCTVLLSTGADILPGDAIVSIGEVELNLARILIVVGLVALVATEGLSLRLFRARVELPIALLVAASLVASAKWGTEPRARFAIEAVALFYLTFGVLRARPEAREGIAAVGLAALALAAVTAVAQVAQGEPSGFYRDGCIPVTKPFGPPPEGSITRAIGTFENPNVLGGYLLLLIPLGALAAAYVWPRAGRSWPLFALVVPLGALAVVFTYSRAAVLMGLVAVAAAIVASRVGGKRWLLLVALVGAVGAAALFGSCGAGEATAGYGRKEEWKQTFEVIKDNPVTGVGLGRLGEVLTARNPKSTARHAHNLYLTWWAEAGTGALIAWVWLTLVLMWRSLRAALDGDGGSRAALAALVGFFLFSMLDHPANVDRVALALWIVLAVAAAGGAARRGRAKAAPPRPSQATTLTPQGSLMTGNVRNVRRVPREPGADEPEPPPER